jgi:hypothetical protein
MSPQATATPAQLIKAAFDQARDSGKPDWQRMTIAVLKNRLLTLTDGQFQEVEFGAQTMREFVKLANDIVSVDNAGFLPVVVWLGEEPAKTRHELPQRIRVRADLWRAIVDYSHHSIFVWDPESNYARVKLVTDDLPVLPTITEDDLRAWRKSFVERHSDNLDAAAVERLKDWQERILSSKTIPSQLATSWLTELSDKVVTRLRLWFAEVGLKEPPDLIVSFDMSKYESTANLNFKTIRRLAIACVKVMNAQELAELRFSPDVYLRALQEQKKRAD